MSAHVSDSAIVIAEAVLRMAIARGAGVLDDITGDVYVKGLLRVDPVLVERACEELGRTPVAEFAPRLPALPDVLQKCDEILRRDARASARDYLALPPAGDERTYACFQCQDDPHGWLWLRCPETKCERTQPHPRHAYVVRCPHWLRQHEAALKLRASKLIEKNARTMPPDIEALWALEKGAYRFAQAVTQ